MKRPLKLPTNLGDLIYALTEDVRRQIHNEKQAYEIVADLLAGMTAARRKINDSGIRRNLRDWHLSRPAA